MHFRPGFSADVRNAWPLRHQVPETIRQNNNECRLPFGSERLETARGHRHVRRGQRGMLPAWLSRPGHRRRIAVSRLGIRRHQDCPPRTFLAGTC